MTIQKPKKEDASKLDALLSKLIEDENQYDNNLKSGVQITKHYYKYLDQPNVFSLMVVDNDIVLGYIYGYIETNKLYQNRVAKLDALYLEGQIRGKKISSKLFEEFKKWSVKNDCKYIDLTVCHGNDVALSLYLKEGFKETKKHMRLEL